MRVFSRDRNTILPSEVKELDGIVVNKGDKQEGKKNMSK